MRALRKPTDSFPQIIPFMYAKRKKNEKGAKAKQTTQQL